MEFYSLSYEIILGIAKGVLSMTILLKQTLGIEDSLRSLLDFVWQEQNSCFDKSPSTLQSM